MVMRTSAEPDARDSVRIRKVMCPDVTAWKHGAASDGEGEAGKSDKSLSLGSASNQRGLPATKSVSLL